MGPYVASMVPLSLLSRKCCRCSLHHFSCRPHRNASNRERTSLPDRHSFSSCRQGFFVVTFDVCPHFSSLDLRLPDSTLHVQADCKAIRALGLRLEMIARARARAVLVAAQVSGAVVASSYVVVECMLPRVLKVSVLDSGMY